MRATGQLTWDRSLSGSITYMLIPPWYLSSRTCMGGSLTTDKLNFRSWCIMATAFPGHWKSSHWRKVKARRISLIDQIQQDSAAGFSFQWILPTVLPVVVLLVHISSEATDFESNYLSSKLTNCVTLGKLLHPSVSLRLASVMEVSSLYCIGPSWSLRASL